MDINNIAYGLTELSPLVPNILHVYIEYSSVKFEVLTRIVTGIAHIQECYSLLEKLLEAQNTSRELSSRLSTSLRALSVSYTSTSRTRWLLM
jgi:uncharacterized protein (DUF111 family)